MPDEWATSRLSRRRFVGGALATGVLAACTDTGNDAPSSSPNDPPPSDPGTRSQVARRVKVSAADRQAERGEPAHRSNGDPDLDPPGVLAYSKGLPHDGDGLPDPDVYRALDRAVQARDFAAIERLATTGERRFVNPLGAWSIGLMGPDPAQLELVPAPAVMSDAGAAEMAELYWMAELRDVPFTQWPTDDTVGLAAAELGSFELFDGIDAGRLFRGPTPGDIGGPYISQFLYHRIPAATLPVEQRIRAYLPGFDFLTTADDWLRSQNGGLSQRPSPATPRFVHTLRDLASYVHQDYAFQLPLHAALILLAEGDDNDAVGVSVPYAPTNPYVNARVQGPFTTLGQPFVMELLGLAANAALRAAWYQKWLVHRRIRPEEVGGRVHHALVGGVDVPAPPRLLETSVLERVRARHGSFLLPQAYPDGCPLHTSYPSGHATIAGACVTVLKALFDGSPEIDEPVVATDDGLGLAHWDGEALTVGGELDKLATNIGYGRNAAGIHYRSDGDGGMRLGEQVAIGLLEDIVGTLPEPGIRFALTSFDGARLSIP